MIDFIEQNWVNIIQILVSVLLVSAILLQHRGTGLGGAFGGASNVYRSKRGIEKFLFNTTIILAVLFVVVSVANLIVKQ